MDIIFIILAALLAAFVLILYGLLRPAPPPRPEFTLHQYPEWRVTIEQGKDVRLLITAKIYSPFVATSVLAAEVQAKVESKVRTWATWLKEADRIPAATEHQRFLSEWLIDGVKSPYFEIFEAVTIALPDISRQPKPKPEPTEEEKAMKRYEEEKRRIAALVSLATAKDASLDTIKAAEFILKDKHRVDRLIGAY